MNTSMNENQAKTGGAFADGLTLVRLLLTPIVMFVIIKGWPNQLNMALLASALFAIAALTDLFDDMTGGAENTPYRQFGWFDDIADTVLITGTLLAMLWVIYQNGMLHWALAVPAAIIIIRDVLVGLIKGSSFRNNGWPETRMGTLKTALTMFAICLLLASPWLTNWIDGLRASGDSIMDIYNNASPYVWWVGQGLLWVAALLSLVTGLQLLTGKSNAANDA